MKNIALISVAASALLAFPANAQQQPGLQFIERDVAESVIVHTFEESCTQSGTVYRRLANGIVCKINNQQNDVFVTMTWQRGPRDLAILVYGSGLLNGYEVGFNDENIRGLSTLLKTQLEQGSMF